MIDLPTDENPVVIIHGDCLDILPQIPDGVVDAVVTDPPYGVGFTRYESHTDNQEQYSQLIVPCVRECNRIAKEGALLFFLARNEERR